MARWARAFVKAAHDDYTRSELATEHLISFLSMRRSSRG